MSTEVVMPQMGESITEGTVSKWLKAVGDRIEKDEPILEISTDKVDAEVPAPSAGVLLAINAQEGETVEVGTVVALIGEESEAGSSPAPAAVAPAPKVEAPSPVQEPVAAVAAPVVEVAAPVASSNEQLTNNNELGTAVVMPQMGESITEGTVSKWLKAVGDTIEKDEPLLEISTDKVDAEVPSPVAGVLLAITAQEGETVEVGVTVGIVGAAGASVTASPAPAKAEVKAAAPVAEKAIEQYVAPAAVEVAATANGKSTSEMTLDELRLMKSSPLVRNIAKEHGIDISRIPGTGAGGRVTKQDILSFIETGAALRPQDLMTGKATAPVSVPAAAPVTAPVAAPTTAPSVPVATGDRVEPMSVMRKKIAQHMTFSKATSAHVTSVYEIDMTNVAKFRQKNKDDFQSRFGTKLTFMPFIFQAVNQALRKFPVVNSQISGENIVYKGDINLGMAVALDWGLIVPVIKKADTMSLSGLALTANDLADRARTKKLMPDEVQGGTFTITNPGVFGGLYGTPIINQPQVAILCVGTIEKRAKVLTTPDGDDYIAIRQMAYFALTYDHRIVDGADAERFLSFMKEYLETTQFSL